MAKCQVDAVTLTLLVIALLPWLAPIVKSVELPGGVKIELQELDQAAARADDAGLLTEPARVATFSYESVAERDPNLALAGLRIESSAACVNLRECTNWMPAARRALGSCCGCSPRLTC